MVNVAMWPDERMLDAIDRFERQGQSSGEIAAAYGMTWSAVMGMLSRIRRDTDAAEAGSQVRRAENRDGGMPVRWWAKRRGRS